MVLLKGFIFRAVKCIENGPQGSVLLGTSFMCCAFSQVHLRRILHALKIIFALPTHCLPLTVSLASHLLGNFSTVVWLGLATCWRRTSERNLSIGPLHALVFLFHAVLTKSWVGQVALRSPIKRHALDLAVSLDD